jgi:hypothetical protein
MRTVRLDIGERPQPGKFYLCRNHELEVYKNLEVLEHEDLEDTGDDPPSCGVIPKGQFFMFAKVAHEQRIPGQIKKVWFYVTFGEMTGIVYNGQIPFHQLLLKVQEDEG